MSAISELFMLFIYILLGGASLAALILTFYRRPYKYYLAVIAVFFAIMLYLFAKNQQQNAQNNELERVGLYYLTAFPNCHQCVLTLKENMTYQVTSGDKIIETGAWRHEQGGDYIITYLIDRGQLGYGKYKYDKSILKYEDL